MTNELQLAMNDTKASIDVSITSVDTYKLPSSSEFNSETMQNMIQETSKENIEEAKIDCESISYEEKDVVQSDSMVDGKKFFDMLNRQKGKKFRIKKINNR